MNHPWLLDAFCCAGGATRGYQQAGFRVLGVDISPQPHYCGDDFVQGDAVKFIREHARSFSAIHASCPCQRFSNCQRIRNNDHPDLISVTRAALQDSGRPWVMENVEGSPLHNPVMLCGQYFPELRVYRHRLFEASFHLPQPVHRKHRYPLRKMGRPPHPDEFMHVVGNFSGVAQAREAMGINWMVRDELREAIPPAYTEYVGKYLIEAVS